MDLSRCQRSARLELAVQLPIEAHLHVSIAHILLGFGVSLRGDFSGLGLRYPSLPLVIFPCFNTLRGFRSRILRGTLCPIFYSFIIILQPLVYIPPPLPFAQNTSNPLPLLLLNEHLQSLNRRRSLLRGRPPHADATQGQAHYFRR